MVDALGGRLVVSVDDIHSDVRGKKQRNRLPLGLDSESYRRGS